MISKKVSPCPSKRSSKTPQLKKRIQDVVNTHRHQAFNECLWFVVQQDPNGTDYVFWFEEAWEKALRPND